MSRERIFAVPEGNEWLVMREGEDYPLVVHNSRQEAEASGREIARIEQKQFMVRSGRVPLTARRLVPFRRRSA